LYPVTTLIKKNMKNLLYCMLFMLFVCNTVEIRAQVTIGSLQNPHEGAVLDLQSNTKGVLFPTVSLGNVTIFQLCTSESDIASAEGMVVYNTNKGIAGGSGKGIYVWYDKQWHPVEGARVNTPDPNPQPDPNLTSCGKDQLFPYAAREEVDPQAKYSGAATAGEILASKFFKTTGHLCLSKIIYGESQLYDVATECPQGWRIPSLAEWAYLSQSAFQGSKLRFWSSTLTSAGGHWYFYISGGGIDHLGLSDNIVQNCQIRCVKTLPVV
jgi:hypothetical protein